MIKITVYIVTKNRVGKLSEALQSVVDQARPDVELIVVDDGSTDTTPEFLSEYDPGIPFRWCRNEISVGAPSARNKAIQLATSEYITGLDDDDQFLPGRLKAFLNQWDDDISLLTTDDVFLRADGSKIRWRKPKTVSLHDILFKNLIGNQVFTRTEYMREVGGFDENLISAQDYDLWIRLIQTFGRAKSIAQPLQVINLSDSTDRISISSEKWLGYYSCYLKHKSLMDPAHRKYQLFTIRQAQNKPCKGCWMSWVPFRFWIKEAAKQFFRT